MPYTGETIQAGRALFVTNCSMCHGINADGVSFVASKFEQYQEKAPPSLSREDLAELPDGSYFWTVTNGVNRMPSSSHCSRLRSGGRSLRTFVRFSRSRRAGAV